MCAHPPSLHLLQTTCSLLVALLAAVGLAADQQGSRDELWAPSFAQNPKGHPAALDWNAQAWRGASPILRPSRPWQPADEDLGRLAAWEAPPQDPSPDAVRTHDDSVLDGDFSEAEKEAIMEVMHRRGSSSSAPSSSPLPSWLAKRQTPRRLGWVVDLYRSVAQGLDPFVPQAETQGLSAAPERRSGRRPAACRFGPLALVCWNAARQVAVIRQRSSQYPQ